MRQRPRKRKRSAGRTITILFCITVLWCGCQLFTDNPQSLAIADNFLGYEVMSDMRIGSPKGYKVAPDLQINSSNAILVDLDDEKILFDKNSTAKIYPASMTKIMTAVVVLEHLNNLNERILLNEEIYSGIYASSAMTAGFLPNEKVHAIDLLYGLLISSGAECAIGLAEHVAGSESAFADLMNDKAGELGMSDTHFVNATGLHDARHYSTVKDISVLLKYALKNKTFYKVFTAARHSSRPTNLHSGGITYYSTLFSNMDRADFAGGSILGGKTGYTDEAHQCLASLAEKNGKRYILVTSGARGNRETQNLHIDDAFTVYAAIRQ